MNNQDHLFTTGELAHKAGVTVRALQYYDEQGLLKPMITEGGRRKYTYENILRLEQILFFKSLGFSLEEINKKILDSKTSVDLEKIFAQQRKVITGQIEHLNNIIEMLDATIAETKIDQEINMERLIMIMKSIKDGNPYSFVVRYFDNEQLKSFTTQLFEAPDNIDTKGVFDKLEELYKKGVDPEGKEGQELAKLWWNMVNKFTGGNSKLLKSLVYIGKDIKNWPQEVENVKKPIENFLAKAFDVYLQNNHIHITDMENNQK